MPSRSTSAPPVPSRSRPLAGPEVHQAGGALHQRRQAGVVEGERGGDQLDVVAAPAAAGGVVAEALAHGHDPLDARLLEGERHHAAADSTVGPGHHDDLSHGERSCPARAGREAGAPRRRPSLTP